MPVQTFQLIEFDRHAVQNYGGLIGIDEAGRGALAGPVVASAVWLSSDFLKALEPTNLLTKVNDSKQLSPDLRESIFELILELEAKGSLCYRYAMRQAPAIDASNILRATQEAIAECLLELHKACAKLEKQPLCKEAKAWPQEPFLESPESPVSFCDRFGYIPESEPEGLFSKQAKGSKAQKPARILIDGSPLKNIPYPHTTLVKGDAQSFAIALASIIAKVKRDTCMRESQKTYPQFSFAVHKGYGTAHHREEILKFGPSPLHRASFLQKLYKEQEKALQTQLTLCPPLT